jgi:hypothetical protein
MSYGSVAYQSYARIRSESGDRSFPDWTELSHTRRLAWEAAAQAVALAAFPSLTREDIVDDAECHQVTSDRLQAAAS